MNEDKIGLIVEGGIGDNIMYTPAIRALKKKYPDRKLGVACVYPQVLHHNPHIDELFDARNPLGFFEKYCLGNKMAFHPQPYNSRLYAYGRKHFIDVVCEQCGVEADNHKLDFFLTEYEKEDAIDFYDKIRKDEQFEIGDKPIVLFQRSASFDPVNHRKIIRLKDYPMTYCKKLCEVLKDKIHIIQTGFPEEPQIGCPTVFSHDIRRVAALFLYADSFITVDSNLGHLSAIYDKKGVVMWGRTNPHAFKYDHNINIFKENTCPIQPCGRPEGGFFDIMIADDCNQGPHSPWDCPSNKCMYAIQPEEVASAILSVIEEKKKDPDPTNGDGGIIINVDKEKAENGLEESPTS